LVGIDLLTIEETKMPNTVKLDRREVKEFQGQPISAFGQSEPLYYTPEYNEFTTIDEVRAAGEWPNEKDILDSVNAKRKTAAVAKAYQEVVKPVKERWDRSKAKARKDFIESARLAPAFKGKSDAELAAFADSMGYENSLDPME
jgi:hypothetical protein